MYKIEESKAAKKVAGLIKDCNLLTGMNVLKAETGFMFELNVDNIEANFFASDYASMEKFLKELEENGVGSDDVEELLAELNDASMRGLAEEFYETAQDVFERQSTAHPCVLHYEGNFYFSRGDTLGGTNMLIHNGKGDIIIDTDYLRELIHPYTFEKDEAIKAICDVMKECLK